MITKTGILGGVIEEFETTVGQAVKQVKGAPKQVVKTVAGQTGVSAQNPAAPVGDENNKDIVKALYGKSDSKNSAPSVQNSQNNQPKTPEELEKLAKTRQDLQRQHKETYYDPTFNRRLTVKVEEEEKKQEEKKEEQEKKIEFIQKKQEKDKNLAAQRAQQRVEKIPGAG